MKLKKLTAEHVQAMKRQGGQNIYLVDFSEKYLEELLAKYEVASHLAGILSDTDDRISGSIARGSQSVSFQGMELPIYPYSYFCSLEEEAFFIILNDYFKESYRKLVQLKTDVQEKCSEIYFFADRETEFDLYYRKKYADAPLENRIIFRSGPHASAYIKGMDYVDNARALFEYMLEAGYYHKYELIWLVKNPSEFSYIMQKYENVRFLSFDWSVAEEKEERDAYYKALCLAKYIFMTDAYGFCRNAREDQIRVQLWHGCGFKTRVNFVRCEKRYEYNIVISEVYKKIHEEIYGLRKDQVLVTGYPKNDWLFHTQKRMWRKFQFPDAEKYIFWLPTFRMAKTGLSALNEYDMEGQTGLPVIDTYEKLRKLDRLLWELHAVIILKLHPFQDRTKIGRLDMRRIVMLDHEQLLEKQLQINQILGCADALISDYSSAAVDYMLLDKPIGFTLDDMEEYENSRGFVFENIRDWLPGKEINSFKDFCGFVGEISRNIDSTREKRRELTDKMHLYRDERSCQRVVEALGI